MEDRCGDSLCFEDLQLSQPSSSLQCDDNNENISFREIKGKKFAVKKLALDCDGINHDKQHWKKLIKLRDSHIVCYRHCFIHQDSRYLVMESCQGSMLDYCRENLDEGVASLVNGIDIMWQITCGIDYLHSNEISSGNLKLENVLFWKRDLKSKRIVVKIAGYGYKDYQPQDDVKSRLATLYYAAATKKEVVPNEPITPESLSEIDEKHRTLALELISLLTKDDFISDNLVVATLLLHPVFTRWSEEGRSRLIKELQKDEEMCRVWKNEKKLEEWGKSLDKSEFPDEEFDDLNDIMKNADNDDVTTLVSEAFKTTPILFSKYIWHIATSFRISRNNAKNQSIQVLGDLGSGGYGEVFKCNYTDESGKTYLAACKKCSPKRDAVDVFDREVQTLRQLNHLFVVKYLELVENQSERYIVMELCEGSLKDYVEGRLERIPKDSLDDKILISQVALGIAYIHNKDIIHKDLKPANILLWCLPSDRRRLVLAKIADFGFAKELKPGQTEFSNTIHPGTEKYMAPELLNAQGSAYPASFASDVYSFGIIIAEMVKKGDHPFGSEYNIRKASMTYGLVPQNLQGLSWDLKDLILKLTDSDLGKRPKMAIVLRHPYFALTNERTKKYFLDRLWDAIQSLGDRTKLFEKIFNAQSLNEWYHGLSDEKQYRAEDIEKMAKIFKLLMNVKLDVLSDIVYPEKKYSREFMEVIASEYDADVRSQFDQMKRRGRFSRFCLYELILRSPTLLVPYFWSHLNGALSVDEPKALSVMDGEKNQLVNTSSVTRRRRLSREMELDVEMKHTTCTKIISEIEWSSLFCEQELTNELWNIKYAGQYNKSPEREQEIIGLVANCSITEEVWSAILDQLESRIEPLLLEIVRSSACNAPELTRMLLKRYGKTLIPHISIAMHKAALNAGNHAAEIMQILFEHGADVNAQVYSAKEGFLPIHCAATNDYPSAPKIIKVLLENGADPCVPSLFNGPTPVLLAAVNEGNYATEIMTHLLDFGGKRNANDLVRSLIEAMLNNGECGPALVDLLLKNIDIEALRISGGRTLAHLALIYQGVHGAKVMKLILEKGVKPNSCDMNGLTPLHYAVLMRPTQTPATIKVLLENGGDPNVMDRLGNTPVHCAAANEGEHADETLELLLSHGGNVKSKNISELTPVHSALINMGIGGAKVRKLIGVDQESINVRFSQDGKTLLDRFVHVSNAKVVQLILDHGGNPNIQDEFGRSPVYTALQNHTNIGLTILELLLQQDGDPNLADKEQRFTPVHYVAGSLGEKATEQMTILLKRKGDANVSGRDEITPMHIAAANPGIHGPKLMKMLLIHGGNPNAVDANRQTPLHLAIENENDQRRLETILLLLENGGNPNASDVTGRTPVHYIVCDNRSNSLKVLLLLVKKGGNIFQDDGHGMTPFLLATGFENGKHCHPEVRDYLVQTAKSIRKP